MIAKTLEERKKRYSAPKNPCPKCGAELQMGYGLAGGGIGPYEYCSNEQCNHFVKFQDPELEDK